MSGGARPERVAEEFREVLAEEIPRLKDPRVGFVTVTRVEVSPDLRRATVYYTVMGKDRDHRATRALSEATTVALACHVNPDADALGSMLGLAGYLASRGKEVVCSWGNQPLVRPRWLSALDGSGPLVEPRDFPTDPALMVALD